MSHSKRNTSRPVFTSHERALAKSNWAQSSARLDRDSFLPFGSCGLCLGIAREPVACQQGDIFCRECALANLLAQKRELRRAKKARRDADSEAGRIEALKSEEDNERSVRDFELIQAGLSSADSQTGYNAIVASDSPSGPPLPSGSKRKFVLDEEEVKRVSREDKIKARKAIEAEKTVKSALHSFWTPSLTPDVGDRKTPTATGEYKLEPMCPSSSADRPHALSMQKLIPIRFQEHSDSLSGEKRRECPSCLKMLSNSSGPVMGERCGHVLCMSCARKFLVPTNKVSPPDLEAPIMCYVCDTPVATKAIEETSINRLAPGLVTLQSEGTGFSARGSSKVEKNAIAFQC